MILSDIQVQKKLTEQTKRSEWLDNSYLIDEKDDNFKYISKSFFWNDKTKTKLLNSWSWIFWDVTYTYSSYISSPKNPLEINFEDFIRDLISVWKWVLVFSRENWKLNLNYRESYKHINIDWIDYIFTQYEYKKKIYILEERYIWWTIENKLYQLSWVNIFWTNIEVPLSTIPATSNLLEYINTWLDQCLFVLNSKRKRLDEIKNQVYAIDRRIAMIDWQFLTETEQYKFFENVNLDTKADSTWVIDIQETWKNFENNTSFMWQDLPVKADLKVITNDNPLLYKAIEYEDKTIERISAISQIPKQFLWVKSDNSNNTWIAIIQAWWPFYKEIQKIRDSLTSFLTPIFDKIRVQNREDFEINFVYDDIVTKSSEEVLTEIEKARNLRLMTHIDAVKKYWRNTDEEAQDKVNSINTEYATGTQN